MKRSYLALFFLLTLLPNLIILGSAQNSHLPEFGIKEVLKIDIQIDANGFVKVKEKLVLNQTTAKILIPKNSEDLSLLDSQGNNLGYELSEHQEGQILNIFLKSPQEKDVTLSYSTSILTRKNASQWTFKFSSLSTPRVTIVKIEFPLGANITSLRSKEILFIYPPHLTSPLFLYPQSDSLSLEIDYISSPEKSSLTNLIPIILLLLILLLILITSRYIKKRKNQAKEEATPKEKSKINPSVLKMLDEQEKEIIKMLETSPEEEITQAYIYKTLGIPKSSLSDTVRRLEQRDLIEKKRDGRINWIKLKKWVFE